MKLNLTIPVYNEAERLPQHFPRLRRFLRELQGYELELVVVDNGSTDGTEKAARTLSDPLPGMQVARLEQRGRGRALKWAWSRSDAEVCSYMDADLSTDLEAYPALIEAVAAGGHDLAIGSRLLHPGNTRRSRRREIISRSYNRLIRALFRVRFRDAQCGFKAIRREAARSLLPWIEDNDWFMDTELLILAERLGYRIFELPVKWVEEPRSHVKILRTALRDIQGLLRMKRAFARGKYSGAPRHKSAFY